VIGHLLNIDVEVNRRTVTRDGLGGSIETFAKVATERVRLQPMKASEANAYLKEGVTVTHRAFFNHGADVQSRDRLAAFGKSFIVRSVTNPDYADKFLVADVELQD
jgi:SPP1 family predicted phage head-tail adaptor